MNANGEKIYRLRVERGLTLEELAKKIGVGKSTVQKWETGSIKEMRRDKVQALADALQVSPAYFFDDAAPQVPVLGRVAAGQPINAIENIIGYEYVPVNWAKDGDHFGLRIRGDSMSPRIEDGDVVIVRKQSDADDGDVVIAIVNGNDAVCKRLRKYDHSIALVSNNPAYPPMYFTLQDTQDIPVRIIGRVMELIGRM